MICTVSTVKDSLTNVERFVSRNLSSGADHMFIFLDGDDPEVREYLRAHEHVTAVRTGAAYWGGQRPARITGRQRVNANLVNCLLAPMEWADWLFHIDGDECLAIDRDELESMGDDVSYIHLDTAEAVSTAEPTEGEPYFKRRLNRPDLSLLKLLGAIPSASNKTYFHGHVAGKSGIRPSLTMRLGVHDAHATTGEQPLHWGSPRFNVLHYESVTFEEFLRKWPTHVETQGPNVRQDRKAVRGAVTSIVRNPQLSEEVKRELLRDVYRVAVEDDLDLLVRLGFVGRPSPEFHQHAPRPLSTDQHRLIRVLLKRLLQVDKTIFQGEGGGDGVRQALGSVADEVREDHPGLERRLRACLDTAPQSVSP